MHTLMDFRYKKKFAAQPGENGRGSNQTGKDGAPVIIEVPPGTIVRDRDRTGAGDLRRPHETGSAREAGRQRKCVSPPYPAGSRFATKGGRNGLLSWNLSP